VAEGPLRFIDEVGLDVADFIFGEMAHYFPGGSRARRLCSRLLAAGLKGRKNGLGTGFLRYEGRADSVTNAATRSLIPAAGPAIRAARGITSNLMDMMIR